MRRKIDIENWSRRKSYKTFCDFDDPYTGITTTLNVTNVVKLSKDTNNSFYGTMLYFVLLSMNEIDAFKYGYGKLEDELCVFKYDDIAATVTVLTNENELNFTRYIKFDYDYEKFIYDFSKSREDAENNVDYYKIPELEYMNKVQVTCLPWIRFSNFKDAISKSEKSSKPKVCWGRYFEENDEYYMDFSLLVNHAFQDGLQIGLLINSLQKNINKIEIKTNKKELLYEKDKKKN